jgi:hypothetical protein
MRKTLLLLPLPVLLTAGLVIDTFAAGPDGCRRKTIFTESFEGGSNEGNWSFGIAEEAILPSGNPHGDVLITSCQTNPCLIPDMPLATFAPQARTRESESEFTGNLRAKRVTEVGADFRLYRVSFDTYQERPLSLVLVSFNGTPENIDDDLYVFLVGKKNIPSPSPTGNGGWVTYTFDLPTSSPTLPTPFSMVEGDPGWVAADGEIFFPADDPDAVWNRVVENVDEMIFWWHDPRFYAIFQNWKVAMDNASIVSCSD